jgi:molecular chaperone GrpE
MKELEDRENTDEEDGEEREETSGGPSKASAGAAREEKLEKHVEELEEELGDLKDQVKELRDKYLRALADMDNYRKRARKEMRAAHEASNERLICDILPVLDNFERALDPTSSPDSESFRDGVELIYNMLRAMLEREGVEGFCSVGEKFDPARHEAVYSVESKEHPAETVVHEIEKGYMIKDKLLRPARVAVSKGRPLGAKAEESEEETCV